MEDLDFFSGILDNEVIDYYKKINSEIDELELYCLIVDLKRLIEESKKDNKKEMFNLNLNSLIYKFNSLFFGKNSDLDSKFYNLREMLNIESDSLEIMGDIIDYDSSSDVVSKIYLYITSLVEIQNNSLNGFNSLLKKEELDSKNIYFFSGRRVNLEENQENIEKI